MTFEEKLFASNNKAAETDSVKRFQAAARAIFATSEGRIVLGMLCGAAHPLKHSDGMTPHEHGQSEVVATLWRFGSSDTVIQNS